ncbi:MAG: hypothetical protein ACLTSO_07030 [Coprococcus sp.]
MGLVEGKVIIVTGASSGIGEKPEVAAEGEGCSAAREKQPEDVANRISQQAVKLYSQW